MASRLDLQTFLEELLKSKNVYFQPPESVKMKYPAIVYALDDIENVHADNGGLFVSQTLFRHCH